MNWILNHLERSKPMSECPKYKKLREAIDAADSAVAKLEGQEYFFGVPIPPVSAPKFDDYTAEVASAQVSFDSQLAFIEGARWQFNQIYPQGTGDAPVEYRARHPDNPPYSTEADAYVKKLFPCEPPCDSFGVCENCGDSLIFGAGYAFGLKATHTKSGGEE